MVRAIYPPPIWGPSRQLDDQHRNTNMNNKDHLVGQLTIYGSDALACTAHADARVGHVEAFILYEQSILKQSILKSNITVL